MDLCTLSEHINSVGHVGHFVAAVAREVEEDGSQTYKIQAECICHRRIRVLLTNEASTIVNEKIRRRYIFISFHMMKGMSPCQQRYQSFHLYFFSSRQKSRANKARNDHQIVKALLRICSENYRQKEDREI